jgi:dihydrofolate synthase/folylpolyglutamate synthase
MRLDDWLDYQQRVHPRAIALGLDRVREVWTRLGALAPAPVVITVGGTNGKGSTVAFLEAMLRAAGKRVGAYTSPHLLRYNERVRIEGIDVGDAAFVRAFERIEAARADVPLTYFEYGTLAALLLFADAKLDVALLEVGLGGRLDAVNLVDADAAIVTTVDFDHQDWLGDERDGIGREKAGIFRFGRPAIVGEIDPPQGLLDEAVRIGADLCRPDRDFTIDVDTNGWRWRSGGVELALPPPSLDAPCQHQNAAAAIAALYAVRDRLGWHPDAIASGVANAQVAARLQCFASVPELVIDVAHNPQAARMLAAWLDAHPVRGRTLAVFGALGDKDIGGIVAPLRAAISRWHLASLAGDSPRGLDIATLADRVRAAHAVAEIADTHDDATAALTAAFASASAGDRVIAFGSFFVAARALAFADARGFSHG